VLGFWEHHSFRVLVLYPVRFMSAKRMDCLPATASAAKPRMVNLSKSILKIAEEN
jgi:hypothetical protein